VRPLKVLVTRPAAQARPLSEALRAQGFEVVEQPLLEIEPLSDEPIAVERYDYVVVTSSNGARELARRASARPARIAAIGPGTVEALERAGLRADVVAAVHTQEGLVDAFPDAPGRVLFVGAEGARTHLADALDADFLAAYRTVELGVEELADVDVALLASASAARAYANAGGRGPAISIGPQTTAAARECGVDVVAEAESHDVRGLVDSAASWRASSPS
jgi:uroporphyrinogen III methyltransferase / synthase